MKSRRPEQKLAAGTARRAGLLSAVVVRNELVQEQAIGDGVRLSAPVERTGLGRVFGGGAGEKRFDLDSLGAWVWQRVDGLRTVEDLIESFAAGQRVNLREAEVAVTAFLKMLVKRGLVALVVPEGGAA
jgi:hypothetical protein